MSCKLSLRHRRQCAEVVQLDPIITRSIRTRCPRCCIRYNNYQDVTWIVLWINKTPQHDKRFPLLVAPEVVNLINYGAVSDENFVKMTTCPCQCLGDNWPCYNGTPLYYTDCRGRLHTSFHIDYILRLWGMVLESGHCHWNKRKHKHWNGNVILTKFSWLVEL